MAEKYFKEFNNINCGFSDRSEGDAPEIRAKMIKEAELFGGLVVRPKLVHGTDICIIDRDALDAGPYIEVDECDGLITDLDNVVLCTTHGDCIPLYTYDPVKHVIGIAHAGWRGTLGCIASALIYWMDREYGCDADDIRAVIGPGIGACCFETDIDVAGRFLDELPWTEDYISQRYDGKYMIDLKGINCELFEMEGLQAQNIFIDPSCTCCPDNADRYFSYRRDHCSERMLAFIMQKTE